MKNKVSFLLLWVLISCLPEVSKDLQINQSFEGEEAYWASKSLDEHLYLVFQDWESFLDTSITDSLPGCPTITLDSATFSVNLNYGQPLCEDEFSIRKGEITIQYGQPVLGIGDSLRLNYNDYEMEGSGVTGQRLFQLTAKQPESVTMKELTDSLRLIHSEGSSTRLNPAYTHQGKVQSGRVSQITSQGTMEGRNWSGNDFTVIVNPEKKISEVCLSKTLLRPASGTETWTINRTGESPVSHELVYSVTEGCESKTTIRLAEGVVMEKKP
ncbi:hypothetical protein [Cyclobacterium jeungdonense]|uniref:Lipoprotein n=1 Tax=Cyclobacterium jeungdonense TaxID=708087 RepID=A0ABT8C8Z9_9BACT|nr:hypothetical protein [Cyclobacterium jeungdonense]MDN3689274.1 hypothetical protein [Cyclobacterium jeungdonense]